MERMNLESKACVPAEHSFIMSDPKKFNSLKGSASAMIVGFLGAGMVGNIVTTQLIEALKMEQIGYVVTDDLPPIAIFYDGVLKHPFRLYYSKEKQIVVAQCEVPFNKSTTYQDLARLLNDWALNIGIKEICVIQGIAVGGIPENSPVYLAAEEEIMGKLLKVKGIETLPQGLVLGPEAAILNECLNNRLDGYALLTPVAQEIPWPSAAVAVIEKLNQIYKLDVSVQKLIDEDKAIKEKLMELNERMKKEHANMDIHQITDRNRTLYM
ncbi:MAG: proteasome assembly chaperone family protein [Promethearchaeota archaeon]